MKRIILLTSITGFWLVMTGLLIQREFFQISTVGAQSQVLSIDLEGREEYSAILMGKERVGFNFNVLDPVKDNPNIAYELRHQSYLSFLFLGQQREMLIRGKAKLDRKLNLQEFEERISSSNYWTKISGQVAKENLNVVIESNDGEPIRRIIPMKGPVYFAESLQFLWTPENLKIGKKGSFETWNPLLGNFQTVTFHVKEKTKLEMDGKSADAFIIEIVSGGVETKTWVNPEGIVLREESAAGFTNIKEEGWQIFDAMRKNKSQPPDLPSLFSVPSNVEIKNPAELQSLSLKIKNDAEEKTLTIQKENLSDLQNIPLPVPADETNFSVTSYLTSDTWIQSDDPAVSEKAKAIISGSKSALEASQKLLDWVHENISPVPSMSIPQARQVLGVKKGDCNEYTVLYTAFARAVGIPARMQAGLVYQNKRFFYHAWPEIYLGRWIPVDPTFGQMPADVTHIALVEGSLEEQINLVTQLGKIEISITDSK